jgi:PAS domain S-box-containing protein
MVGDVVAELYRELHDHVRDIILVIDADSGQIVEANRAAEQAYHYTRAELLALTIYDLRVEPPPSVSSQMRMADREGSLFETLHRRKDGSVFAVEVSSRGETLGQTRYLLSIVRDVTERKRAQDAHQHAELERERLLATTQHALATREEFLWVASHELRTPITIVSLQLHQLRRSIERGDPADRLTASAEAALAHVDRLSALVQRLLDASQLDNGPRLDLGDVLLGEVARNALERVRGQTDAAGIEITIEIPVISGRWDAVRLEQVLINLLSNAVKYGLRQPIAVSARLDLDLVHLEVRDHGIGLPASETDRIFGKFERAVSTAHYGGLGLGLYIARQIVEAHRGWIEVESAPGRGSTFRVTLPLREDRRGPLRTAAR